MGQKEAQTHAKHNVTVAMAVTTVSKNVLSPMSSVFLGVLTSVTKLAWVEQYHPRREGHRIGHQNAELLRHVPTHVAHRQAEAEPEEPEENFHHFENSERWLF